eukprot:3748758-Karenia_brevis.AAC.1
MKEWEYTLTGMKSIPPEDIMETLFIKQLRKCRHMKAQLALYELGVTQQGRPGNYDVLVHIVRAHLEARRRLRSRENIERGSHGR